MNVKGNGEGKPLASNETSESFSSRSILNWIQNLRTPPTSSYTPLFPENTPTRVTKRCRSIGSIPSEFLGEGPSSYKKQRILQEVAGNMGDRDATGLPTPSNGASSSSRTKSPAKSNTPSISRSTSRTNPQTPKRQKTSTDQDTIGYKMSLYGLLQDDAAFDEASDFRDYVTDIVTSERGSTMKDASAKRFRNYIKAYKWSNEATFLYHMIPILQGYGYHVAGNPAFTPGEEEKHQQENAEWKEFLMDEKVMVTLNKDFAKTLLPNKFSEIPLLIDEIAKDLAKDKDMTNPRPDMTFGLQRDRHPLAIETQIPQNVLELLEVAPGMHYAFLIIEGKSHSGDSAKAENQARRGGATLVKASRTLRAELERGISTLTMDRMQETRAVQGIEGSIPKVGRANLIRPDYESFVFSVTISPTYLSIWVHWYDEGSQLYHMNLVESYALHNSKGPVRIRWALHNIIEFGVRTRGPQNERLLKLIEDYVRAHKQRTQDEITAAREDVKTARAAASNGKSIVEGAVSGSNKRRISEDEA